MSHGKKKQVFLLKEIFVQVINHIRYFGDNKMHLNNNALSPKYKEAVASFSSAIQTATTKYHRLIFHSPEMCRDMFHSLVNHNKTTVFPAHDARVFTVLVCWRQVCRHGVGSRVKWLLLLGKIREKLYHTFYSSKWEKKELFPRSQLTPLKH